MPINKFKKEYQETFTGYIPSPYDSRDYKFSDLVPLGAVSISESYESPEIPRDKIFNQGKSSMCCACAFSSIRYMQEIKSDQSEIDEIFSPTFTYGNRLPGEDFEGMYIRSCLKKAKEDGSLPISQLSGFYSTKECKSLVEKKKSTYLKKAKPFRISSYYQCRSRIQMQQAIIETGGILAGIWIYDCFYKPEKGTGRIIYNPLRHTNSAGGHAVVLCGWKKIRNKLYWKLLNSWGPDYGLNGYVWIPENYPMTEDPWCAVDGVVETKWIDYKNNYLITDIENKEV